MFGDCLLEANAVCLAVCEPPGDVVPALWPDVLGRLLRLQYTAMEVIWIFHVGLDLLKLCDSRSVNRLSQVLCRPLHHMGVSDLFFFPEGRWGIFWPKFRS